MEKRRNNRRDDDNRRGNGNNRQQRGGFERNANRKGKAPQRNSRSGGRSSDNDAERNEMRRRRAIQNENWFDLEPDQSSNFGRYDDRDDRRRNRSRANERDGYREKTDRDDRRDNRDSRPARGGKDFGRRDDRHERSYREYRRGHSYNDYNDFDSDDDDYSEYTDSRQNFGRRTGSRKYDSPRRQRYQDDDRRQNKSDDESTRLNKYIANAGICSRREADVLIASGAVSVNGEVVTQLGYKVKPGDEVHYGGQRLSSERKRYILLNKPKGYITTMDDPQERKTVMTLIANACKERVYPVGRLDRNTTGLLLFTNDGDLAKKLTHPSTGARKVYHVELDKPLAPDDRRRMLTGLTLEDGDIAVDAVEYSPDDRNSVGVELHSGRNRIVRRIFESLGYEVYKLDRVIFAELTKKNLPRGQWRELSPKEVGFLKML